MFLRNCDTCGNEFEARNGNHRRCNDPLCRRVALLRVQLSSTDNRLKQAEQELSERKEEAKV